MCLSSTSSICVRQKLGSSYLGPRRKSTAFTSFAHRADLVIATCDRGIDSRTLTPSAPINSWQIDCRSALLGSLILHSIYTSTSKNLDAMLVGNPPYARLSSDLRAISSTLKRGEHC